MKTIGLMALTVLALSSTTHADDLVVTNESELVVVMDCLAIPEEKTEEAMAKALSIIGKTDFDAKVELTMTKDGQTLGVYPAQGSLMDGPLNLKFGENAEYSLTSEGSLSDFVVQAILTGPQGQTNLLCAAQ